jgi:hypothetical protein
MESLSAVGMTRPTAGEEPARLPLELSGRPREILDILVDLKGDAGVLYEGALRVVADGANPVRIRLAAYALRELMDDLAREAGFTRQGQGLKERVGELQKEWRVARRSFEAGSDGRGTGFVQTLDKFFVAYDADYPKRRDQARATIAALDPAKREAPPAVREARANAWMRYREYFNGVLHGSIPPDAEFRSRFEGFESFLLDWFGPRTFADLDAIDELIRKGPPNG